jgi:hypothetical protein
MRENTTLKFTLSVLMVLFFTSCGVISKARYGNGFSIHIENNWFGKNEVKKERKFEKNEFQDSFSNALLTKKTKVEPLDNQIAPQKVFLIETPKIGLKKEEKGTTRETIKTESSGNSLTKNKSFRIIPRKSDFSNSTNQMEPNASAALFFFLLMFVLYVASYYFFSPIISYGLFFSYILSFVLAIVSLGKIKNSDGAYTGKGIDIFIIVFQSLILLLSILALLILIALFA